MTAGPVALVTGASRGIGLAIAREISRHCSEIVLVARSATALTTAKSCLAEEGRIAHVVASDLTETAGIERLVKFVKNLGRLDILVHAAGAYDGGSVTGTAIDLMALNYEAPARLTTGLLELIKASNGQIVFINSTQGLHAGRNVGAYAASKFALRGFADSLRAEVNRDGVRVLTVYAGSTATAMQERIHERAGLFYRPERLMQPEDIASIVASALLLPRTAEVTELTIRPMHPPDRQT